MKNIPYDKDHPLQRVEEGEMPQDFPSYAETKELQKQSISQMESEIGGYFL